jgi:hypothetical protein
VPRRHREDKVRVEWRLTTTEWTLLKEAERSRKHRAVVEWGDGRRWGRQRRNAALKLVERGLATIETKDQYADHAKNGHGAVVCLWHVHIRPYVVVPYVSPPVRKR